MDSLDLVQIRLVPDKKLYSDTPITKAEDLRPGEEFDLLYEAAECRARADWLVGMNLTRLYTLKYGNGKPLNVGRVKSPTLSLIVQRETQIRDFVKEPYFVAHIVTKGMDAVSEHISDRYKTQKIAEDCRNRQAYVEKIERERKKMMPPSLYDLTTLQRDANRCFSLSAKDTLNVVQQLYENVWSPIRERIVNTFRMIWETLQPEFIWRSRNANIRICRS